MTGEDTSFGSLSELTAQIVAAYVSRNPVPSSALPDLIISVNLSLSTARESATKNKAKPVPAVNPRKSVTPEFIVCLEDGKKFKSLRRHLGTSHGLSPDQYRAKWGLARDYPMSATNYSAARSALAKSMGLGKAGNPKRGKGQARPGAEKNR
ncbi:MucR family transcriptional regulator [Mesorhizobium sp. B1-1-8]|uniref:MucR family transcriptional regulator n=1 Tax=Mesorhizobium sp. B1-1-8 TaxID=2589976 RepID=UPI00112ACC4E|nr:MucR family transcriptional regulator [Mesorhizobium sp. B1-1-8]UCI10697.1 MucR family transcriptional regulator [Mesorhizobium sp. B1-1-8]